MKAWNALFESLTDRELASRWLLCLGVLVAVCLMALYVQVLRDHVARAEQVRLGPPTAAIRAASTRLVLPVSSDAPPASVRLSKS